MLGNHPRMPDPWVSTIPISIPSHVVWDQWAHPLLQIHKVIRPIDCTVFNTPKIHRAKHYIHYLFIILYVLCDSHLPLCPNCFHLHIYSQAIQLPPLQKCLLVGYHGFCHHHLGLSIISLQHNWWIVQRVPGHCFPDLHWVIIHQVILELLQAKGIFRYWERWVYNVLLTQIPSGVFPYKTSLLCTQEVPPYGGPWAPSHPLKSTYNCPCWVWWTLLMS